MSNQQNNPPDASADEINRLTARLDRIADAPSELERMCGDTSDDLDARAIEDDARAEWGEPDWSIFDDRRGELPEFPVDVLAPALKNYLERAARGAGVTIAHVAVPLISITSGILGAARRIQASRSWREPLTIWTALLGFSGTGKTPGIKVTKLALTYIEENRVQKIAELERKHETRLEASKAAHKKWLGAVEEATEAGRPPPPMPMEAAKVPPFVRPRIFVTDATVEKLTVLLQVQPSGIQGIYDELAGLFANMGRYSSGSDKAFWLEAWNGNSYAAERMGRPSVDVKHLLVGITGGLQPDKMAASFEGDDDGMYARVCFAWPSEPAYQPLSDDVDEREPELINALEKLVRLTEPDDDGTLATRDVRLSREAAAAFDRFRRYMYASKGDLDGREREWWAKGDTQVLRIAGTLAFLTWAWSDARAEPNEIERSHIDAAIALWDGYFWPHSRAALRQVGLTKSRADDRLVLRWIKETGKDAVSVMDVRRDALSQRLNEEQTKELLGKLTKAGWLKLVSKQTGGRPTLRWDVNPILHAESAGSAESLSCRPSPDLSALSALPASGYGPRRCRQS